MNQMKNNKIFIAAAIILSAAVLAVVGMIYLPDTIVVQINSAGEASNTLPKLPALLLPSALAVIFAVMYLKNAKGKDLATALVGIGILAITLIFNL